MPRPDEEVPVEPAENEQNPSDADATGASPSDAESQPSTATDDESTRTLRDIQTAHGRQLADERRAREAAQAQVVALSQQVEGLRTYVSQVGSAFNQQQQQARADYLRRLPPEQRLAAEHQMLKQEVAALRQGQIASRSQQSEQFSDAEIRDYMANRSRELVQEANDDFGLDGDEAAIRGRPQEIYRAAPRSILGHWRSAVGGATCGGRAYHTRRRARVPARVPR
jgi:hypothetical protein